MPYAHRTEFPRRFGDYDVTNDGWKMPDGSGPWTVVAVAERDQPAGRFGERGLPNHVEVTDAKLNRYDNYHHRADAENMADTANKALEAYLDTGDERLAKVHEGVDYYDVKLRQNAELIVSGDNADGIGGDN